MLAGVAVSVPGWARTKVSPTNPPPTTGVRSADQAFGVFYYGTQVDGLAALGVGVRLLLRHDQVKGTRQLTGFDEFLLRTDAPVVFSFSAIRKKDRYKCAISKAEFAEFLRMARMLVERYDGDDDYGCVVDNGRDCYARRDGLLPSPALKERLASHPIEVWSVANEWLSIRDCSSRSKDYVSGEGLVTILREMSGAIRSADPDAIVLSGATTGTDEILAYKGYYTGDDRYVEQTSSDCQYQRTDDVERILASDRLTSLVDRHDHVLTEGREHYDAVDFHTYSNRIETGALYVGLVRDLLGDDVPVVSTEFAGPANFFLLMGEEQPTDCGGGRRPDHPYSEQLHAEFMVKKVVTALGGGVSQLYWATLAPLDAGWDDHFIRLAMIEVGELGGHRKPAFHTYGLMAEKLRGHTTVQEVQENVFRFGFGDRDVYVAWGDGTLDLSPHMTAEVLLTHVITERHLKEPRTELVPADAIELRDAPVFIEAIDSP